ncbi:unnamed protein product [Durusdinium trenchii]|uniref:Uncharacterized protein n=1 Tax=Durusdinium trenchii TaxID=1381693 RepID=A0ABP0HS36_9DINO
MARTKGHDKAPTGGGQGTRASRASGRGVKRVKRPSAFLEDDDSDHIEKDFHPTMADPTGTTSSSTTVRPDCEAKAASSPQAPAKASKALAELNNPGPSAPSASSAELIKQAPNHSGPNPESSIASSLLHAPSATERALSQPVGPGAMRLREKTSVPKKAVAVVGPQKRSESPGSEMSSVSHIEDSPHDELAEFECLWKGAQEKIEPKILYIVDNESGIVLTITRELRTSVHAFRYGHLVWSSEFSKIEKKALGQGFVAFATHHHVHVLSSASGMAIFPPLRLKEPLEQMHIQHGFLLLLCRAGEIKVIDIALRTTIAETSLQDLCEPTELSEESLQLNDKGELSLYLTNRQLQFDTRLRLWMQQRLESGDSLKRADILESQEQR